MTNKIIYLDFDGTVVEHAWPKMGEPVPFALEVIHKLQRYGFKFVLNTYRSNIDKVTLQQAIDYLERNGVILSTVTDQKIQPFSWDWKRMMKEGKFWIDDITPGIPLLPGPTSGNVMVDWKVLDQQFKANNIYV